MNFPYGTATFEELFPYDTEIRNEYRYIQCKLGWVPHPIWCILASDAIKRAGENELYEQLCHHAEKYNLTGIHQNAQQQALEWHITRVYNDPAWYQYATFNATYRNAELRPEDMTIVACPRCNKSSIGSRAHLLSDRNNSPHFLFQCPHCKHYSNNVTFIKLQCNSRYEMERYFLDENNKNKIVFLKPRN